MPIIPEASSLKRSATIDDVVDSDMDTAALKIDLKRLEDLIHECFKQDDLERFCRLDLNLDPEDFNISNKKNFIHELTQERHRQNKVADFLVALVRERPKLDWENVFS